MSPVIFLLGAGASMDAGMPSVVKLTAGLRERLPSLRDINGNTRAEFPALFDAIAQHDGEVSTNYERFFEWLALMRQGQRKPFYKLVRFDLEQHLVTAAGELAWSIKLPIWEFLRARHQAADYRPAYLAKLGDFLPARGRLPVFTLNYDLCVEDACAAGGIELTTGFRSDGGRWTPSLFRAHARGINLFKLHGSLNWNLGGSLSNRRLVQNYPPRWETEPELILGPGSKLQHDEPFVTLYSAFHKALRRAKVCVAVGYSFRDDHIKEPLHEASRRRLTVIDVNPSSLETGFARYKNIRLGAKEALENGVILDAVRSVIA